MKLGKNRKEVQVETLEIKVQLNKDNLPTKEDLLMVLVNLELKRN